MEWTLNLIHYLVTFHSTLYSAGSHYGSQEFRQKFMSRWSCTLVTTIIHKKAAQSPTDARSSGAKIFARAGTLLSGT